MVTPRPTHWTRTPEGRSKMRALMIDRHAKGLMKRKRKRGPGRPPGRPAVVASNVKPQIDIPRKKRRTRRQRVAIALSARDARSSVSGGGSADTSLMNELIKRGDTAPLMDELIRRGGYAMLNELDAQRGRILALMREAEQRQTAKK